MGLDDSNTDISTPCCVGGPTAAKAVLQFAAMFLVG